MRKYVDEISESIVITKVPIVGATGGIDNRRSTMARGTLAPPTSFLLLGFLSLPSPCFVFLNN